MYIDDHAYIYTHTNIHIHKYIHIYICIQHTYKTSIQNMTKQSINGNTHGYTHILNLYDLIPQNGQTYRIKFLGMFDNTMGSGF